MRNAIQTPYAFIRAMTFITRSAGLMRRALFCHYAQILERKPLSAKALWFALQ